MAAAFFVFMLMVQTETGQIRNGVDEKHPYATYAECTQSIPARLGPFETLSDKMGKDGQEIIVAMGCVKMKQKDTPT